MITISLWTLGLILLAHTFFLIVLYALLCANGRDEDE